MNKEHICDNCGYKDVFVGWRQYWTSCWSLVGEFGMEKSWKEIASDQ